MALFDEKSFNLKLNVVKVSQGGSWGAREHKGNVPTAS